MLLQIHDEVVLEVDVAHAAKVKEIIKKTMEGIVSWDIPIEVTVRQGKNWGDVTK